MKNQNLSLDFVGEILEKKSEVNASGMTISEIILKTESKSKKEGDETIFMNKFPISFFSKKGIVNPLKKYEKGEKVKIKANLKSNPYEKEGSETKYFVNIVGWKIENVI